MKTRYLTKSPSLLAAAVLASLASLNAHADYQSTVTAQNPVQYFRLNETAPSVAPGPAVNTGSLGAAANGVLTNGALAGGASAIVSDPSGKSGIFPNAAGNRVRVPHQAGLAVTGPFTVEFWANPAALTSGDSSTMCPVALTQFGDPPGQNTSYRSGWLFYQDGAAGWTFRTYGPTFSAASAIAAAPVTPGRWYHIVGKWDGTSTRVYVNGQLTATASALTFQPVTNSTVPFTIGARADGGLGYFRYNGQVDEVAYYPTALSDARILAHYQAGTNTSPATPYQTVVLADGPNGYWRLNEAGDPPAANIGSQGAAGNGKYIYAAVTGQTGPVPPALAGFEAANKAVRINASIPGQVEIPGPALNTNTVTITAWVKATSSQAGDAGIVFFRDGQTQAGLRIDAVGGYRLGYNWADTPGSLNFITGPQLVQDEWTFVALIVEPTKATIWKIDQFGANNAVNVQPHVVQSFAGAGRIGSDPLNALRYFDGLIDEVTVFGRALSAAEVYAQYSTGLGGNQAPIILESPTAPSAIFATETLTLTVQAGGSQPLSYQWRKDNNPITGATTSSYSKVVTTADSGSYDVVVTNLYGNVTSGSTYVFVNDQSQPFILTQPMGRNLYPGGTLKLTVGVQGGNLRYQWRKNSNPIASATNSVFIIPVVSADDAGTYSVTATNSVGTATSDNAVLTVTVPTPNTYASLIVTDTPTAWWRMDEASSGPLADAMGRHDGEYFGGGQTFSVQGAVVTSPADNKAVAFDGETSRGYARIPFSPDLNGTNFTIEVWAKVAGLGERRSSPVSSFAANSGTPLQGKGYGFDVDLTGVWQAFWGQNADGFLFTIVPIGNVQLDQWEHLVYTYNDGQLVFWRNGVRYPEPGFYYGSQITRNTSAEMLIAALQPGNGSYDYYFNGIVDEVAYYPRVLTDQQILDHYNMARFGLASPPVVSLNPTNQIVIVGGDGTIVGTVGGTPPVTNQWWFNGSAIPDATNTTLTVTGMTYPQAGVYQLRSTNSAGNASANASIVVMPQPQFVNATNGLVLHLPFDGNAQDSTGRGNNGTPVGGPTYVAGKLDQAIQVVSVTNGSGGLVSASYVNLGLRPDLQFGAAANFSVSFWLKYSGLAGDLPIFGNAENAMNNPGYCIAPGYYNGGWQWGLGSQIYAGSTVNNGQWHNLIVVFDRTGNATTYLDGVQVNSRVLSAINLDTGSGTTIGQDPTGAYPEAGTLEIDDLGVWRRTLTPYEAYSIYYVGQTYGRSFNALAPVQLEIQPTPTGVALIWQAGTLLEAPTVNGPWTPVPGATAPYYTVTPGAGNKFYRAAN
jgi:hypothetical protein